MVFTKSRIGILILFCVLSLAYLPCMRGCKPEVRLNSEFQARAGISPQMRKLIDEYRSSIPTTMKKHNIPGLSIALVDNKCTLWAAGFGYADWDGETIVTHDTIFSIQSMSKTFTATSVMFAVQDGLVDLDTPITEYLPDFKVNSRFEENPEKKITLRHLLSHTAGFTHEAPVGNNFDTIFPSFEKHTESISDTWLKFRVGERYSYSNLGIDLTGHILKFRSGKSFEQYMNEKIFDPLEMPSSSIDKDVIRETKNRALGHQQHVKIVPVDIPMVAAGGVYTNAMELAKFVRFHLNKGRVNSMSILDEKLLEEMYTVRSPSRGYGLGIAVGRGHDSYFLAHGGGGFGFLTYMIWYPEYGIGAVVLTNTTEHPLQGKISNTILDRMIEKGIVKRHIGTKATFNPFPIDATMATKDGAEPQNGTEHEPSPYKHAWKKYIGKYRYLINGSELKLYAKIAVALGYPANIVKIHKKDGNLYLHDEVLDEHLPGLFFTPSGEAIDFRGPVPTWRNIKLKKI